MVLRLHMLTKGQVLQRVLVATVDLGICRQTAELLHHGGVHHLRRSLEEPAGAPQEESVACEDEPVLMLGDVVADMSGGVTRSKETRDLHASNTVTVSVPHKPDQISLSP